MTNQVPIDATRIDAGVSMMFDQSMRFFSSPQTQRQITLNTEHKTWAAAKPLLAAEQRPHIAWGETNRAIASVRETPGTKNTKVLPAATWRLRRHVAAGRKLGWQALDLGRRLARSKLACLAPGYMRALLRSYRMELQKWC